MWKLTMYQWRKRLFKIPWHVYWQVVLSTHWKFSKRIDNTSNIISRNLGIIARMRYCLDKRTSHLLYNSLILPYLNYCCLIWGINYSSQLGRLVILQKRLIEHVYSPPPVQFRADIQEIQYTYVIWYSEISDAYRYAQISNQSTANRIWRCLCIECGYQPS